MDIGGLLNARHAAHQLHQSIQMEGPPYGQVNHHDPNQHQLHDYGQLSHHSLHQQSQSQIFQANFDAREHNMKPEPELDNGNDDFGSLEQPEKPAVVKPFACGEATCLKRFARKSDLSRHERIHTGERPHPCDYPGCKGSFIQKSALNVHYRTHTGEKPHPCEICDKRFSDSSSLARHRKTHSGERNYRCPVRTCQKTFTRKTTLTRHEVNNHRGSLDPSSQDTTKRPPRSSSSRSTTVSPGECTLSVSPGAELAPMVGMQRSVSEQDYLPQPSLPPHMRVDFQLQFSPRSTPSVNGHYLAGSISSAQTKPSPTSHPNAYGPPQPLEPPANGTASGSSSPHMGPLSWGSPNHGTLPSPSALNYGYPDGGFTASSLFYPAASGIRRPQSTEPEDYGIRPRGSHAQAMAQVHHAVSMPMTADWSTMPVAMHDMKQERYVV